LIGLSCFVMVVIMEVIGGFMTHKHEIYQILIVLEEAFEIFGASMFLIGVLKYKR